MAELDRADRPGWPVRSGSELAHLLRAGISVGYQTHLWFARDAEGDGARAAAGWLHLPTLDNGQTAVVEIRVRPDLRRRGIGTGFLRTLIGAARAEGRTRISTGSRRC